MKTRAHPIAILFLSLLAACSGSSDNNAENTGVRELALRQTVSGSISATGEVDWYRVKVADGNNVLNVKCTSDALRPDVEFSVAVFELDDDGEKVRLHGDHATEDSVKPADIQLNIYVAVPKDLYIAVRDLMDDESSSNHYHLRVDYVQSNDGNDTFSDALELEVDGASPPPQETIGRVGDMDCFKFTAPSNGVYSVDVEFSPFAGGTTDELAIELYSGDGDLVQMWQGDRRTSYTLLPYLVAGEYYVVVKDVGRDDFDASSTYTVAVSSVAAAETAADDTIEAAVGLASIDNAYSAAGALEYDGDVDWHSLPEVQVAADSIKVLKISFTGADQSVNYQIQVQDQTGATLLTHEYTGGSSAEYTTQLMSGEGVHYFSVQAAPGSVVRQAAAYELSVQVLGVVDPQEADPGNDVIENAIALTPGGEADGVWVEGKIAYRGDVDWYSIQTDTDRARILEAYLETDEASSVDYSVSIMRDALDRKMFDALGEDGPTRLQTSLLVPAAEPPAPITYFFKVNDFQGNDGDGDIPYRIRTNVIDVPESLPSNSGLPDLSAIKYFSEVDELSGADSHTVILEMSSLKKRAFAANTTMLAFNGPAPSDGITRVDEADGSTTIVAPWIGGYVDYDGDQDWFVLDLAALQMGAEVPATNWHYELQVEMYIPAPGSQVEYVWKLYRDANGNDIVVDMGGDTNGFFASAGDLDDVVQPLDIITPAVGDDNFWVGDQWEGRFYLSISDFNYIYSGHIDNDWGYDAPYYFRVTLVYRPGMSSP